MNGSFVSSENLTVMASPAENPGTTGTFRSAAVIDMMNGPAFVPKLPVNVGDIAVDTNDVPAAFLRLADSSTVNLNPILRSLTIGPEPPVLLTMVMTRTEALVQVPT